MNFIFGIRLKFNQKLVSYFNDTCATIVTVRMSCQVFHYYSLQYSDLDKTDIGFFSFILYIVEEGCLK